MGGHGRNPGSGRGALRVHGNQPHPEAGAPVACWGLSLTLGASGAGARDLPHGS